MKKLIFIVLMVALLVTGCATRVVFPPAIEITTEPTEQVSTEAVVTDTDYLKVITQEEFDSLYSDGKVRNYAQMFIGKQMPNLETKDTQGNLTEFASLTGKPYVIEFMGTWCPACTETYPVIEDFVKNNPDATILSVTVDETPEVIEQYMTQHGFTKPINSATIDGAAFFEIFKLEFVPAFFFVNEQGVIERIHIGGLDAIAIQNIYDNLIK